MDLIALFYLLREKRWLVAKITGSFLIVGLVIALFSPVEYTSDAMLMPDTESQSQANNLLQNFGGMFGFGGYNNTGGGGGSATIAPNVYPKIVHSLTFQDSLLNKEIYFSNLDTTLTGYTYFNEVKQPSLFGYLMKYTIRLPELFASEETPENSTVDFKDGDIVSLTNEKLRAIKKMRQRVSISLDSETGILDVKAKMPDAVAAAHVNREVINLLKGFIKSYSTQKAKEDLAFAETQYEQAEERFNTIQNELATFRDQNVNLSTAKSEMRGRRLEAEFNVVSNVYNNISQQLITARMKVQEETPVFKPLQEVSVPVKKSEPRRILIILLFLCVGLIFSFFYVAIRSIYSSLQHKMYH